MNYNHYTSYPSFCGNVPNYEHCSVSKCYHKNVSHLINKENVSYIKNAVVCVNNKNKGKFYFFDIFGNLIKKQVFSDKPSIQEITNLLDHNIQIENAFCYELKTLRYKHTMSMQEENVLINHHIEWKLISNTGSILITSQVSTASKIGKTKFYTVLDNCMDPNRDENFLKPCSVVILKSNSGDYKVNYYGLNKRFLLSNTFPYKITLKNDLQTILDDKRFDKVWCSDNLENIKIKSNKTKKRDCLIL